jgi:ribosomal protein S18 acetylase RimI-like enzyme
MMSVPQSTNEISIAKLTSSDRELGGALFALMARIFDESSEPFNSGYLDHLLGRDDFWVFAALVEGQPVAGLTAFVVPLTRARTSELLIYDLAVQPAYQRRGIGRRLVEAATALAARFGFESTWIPVASEEDRALEFYRAIGGKPSAATIFTFRR